VAASSDLPGNVLLSGDKTKAGRAPGQPNPNLVIDLSDPDAIARTAHDVAVALAEGRLSGRAGQALMTAIRLAIEATQAGAATAASAAPHRAADPPGAVAPGAALVIPLSSPAQVPRTTK
jgi:hypothetical protein